MLKMNNLIEKLARLGFLMDYELSVDLVLQSLPPNISQFMLNYNMNKLEASLPKLSNMLQSAEPNLKKEKGKVLVVESSGARKKRPKKKKVQKPKMIKPKKGIKKDKASKEKYHFCGKEGH